MFPYCISISFNFEGDFYDKSTTIEYDKHTLEVKGGGDKELHNIIIPLEQSSGYLVGFRAGCRFLNELCWFNRVKISDIMAIHGNGRPTIHGRNTLLRHDKLMIYDFKQRIQAFRFIS